MADRDVWYRTITNRKHVKNNGLLHHAALKDFIDPPAVAAAEWKSEYSGRLRSVANDIQQDGERRATRQRELKPEMHRYFQFCAVIFARPADVRLLWTVDRADILFHPRQDDHAHANLVFFDRPPDDLKELSTLSQIISNLGIVSSESIASMPLPEGGLPR